MDVYVDLHTWPRPGHVGGELPHPHLYGCGHSGSECLPTCPGPEMMMLGQPLSLLRIPRSGPSPTCPPPELGLAWLWKSSASPRAGVCQVHWQEGDSCHTDPPTVQDSAQGGPGDTPLHPHSPSPGGHHGSGPVHVAIGDLCTIGVTLDAPCLLL